MQLVDQPVDQPVDRPTRYILPPSNTAAMAHQFLTTVFVLLVSRLLLS